VTLEGCSSTVLDAASQSAIVAATAKIMTIDESSVTFVGTALAADMTTLASGGKQKNSNIRGTGRNTLLAASHTLVAIVATSVLLSDTNFPSPTILYDNLTMKLAQAVSSGRYDTALQQSVADNDATQLTSATATAVASSPLVVTTEPVNSGGGGGGSSLSMYTIIGVALILFLGVCIISGCCYWHCVWSKRFRGPRSNMSRTVNIGEGNLVKKKPSFRNRLFKKLSKTRSGFSKLGTEGAAGAGEMEFQDNPQLRAAERFQQTKEKSTFFEDAVWDLDEAEESEEDGGMGMHDVQL
jgi:hypothetical protein